MLARQALGILPDNAQTSRRRADLEVALAVSFGYRGRVSEARELLASILRWCPEHEEALWYDTEFAFFTDPWPVAWKGLETRWLLTITGKRPNLKAVWDGSSLNGRTIVLAGEGGLGDHIQFVRFAASLKSAGAGRVIVSAPRKLAELLATAPYVDSVHTLDSVPDYDAGIEMLSVPGVLGTTPETLPVAIPYLSVPAEAIARARRRLREEGRALNIGIVPRSRDGNRALPLELLRPISQMPDVRLFALGEQGSLVERVWRGLPVADLTTEDMVSAAAAYSVLDLVLAPDTMGAHLAGALGKPVWLILDYVPEWRWGLTGETTPWYPTMRLFRQPYHDWNGLFQRVAEEVRVLLHRRADAAVRYRP